MSQITTTCFIVLLFFGCITAQISHEKFWETVRVGRNKIIKCSVDSSMSLSSTIVHLYRQRPGEAILRIMHFQAGAKSATNEAGIPSRFNGKIREQTVSLTISSAQKQDEATYYCALWKGDEKVFGSGTRLYVTDSPVKSLKLSAYPISKPNNGKRTLLCQARGMFPDLVRFTWKDASGTEVKQSDTYDLLEQKDEGQELKVTSMLIVDQQKASSTSYTCSVHHENEQSVTIQTNSSDEEKKVEVDPSPGPAPTCAPSENKQQDLDDEDKERDQEEKEVLCPSSLQVQWCWCTDCTCSVLRI
ncbi:immunoglobulin lambda-1 light chain-like isoform X2 [Pygocentrus nattereri]|uniref:immunoglobulin lambda-1 light chain-like isoform X2 n=1 Tax=Pygocentrus nattereri TaxID=42514 RepID=UPI00189108AB|nr:immunoglobulin lambda-1 light chain-like isoform X2 [Pygocentrus nattereri]